MLTFQNGELLIWFQLENYYNVPFIERFESLSLPHPSSLSPSPPYKSVNPIPFARSFLWDSFDLLFVIIYMIMLFRTRGPPFRSLSPPFPFPTPFPNERIVKSCFGGSCIPGQGSPERSERRGQVQCEKEVFCASGIIRRKPQPATFTLTHAHRRPLLPILLHKESVHVTLTWRKERKRERERGRETKVERTDVMGAR